VTLDPSSSAGAREVSSPYTSGSLDQLKDFRVSRFGWRLFPGAKVGGAGAMGACDMGGRGGADSGVGGVGGEGRLRVVGRQ